MTKDALKQLITNIIRTDSEIEILREFSADEAALKGEIQVFQQNHSLNFIVEVPYYFPLHDPNGFSLRFTSDFTHASHQGPNGFICLHPPLLKDPEQQMKEEFQLLKNWMRRFYINQEKDYLEPVYHQYRADSPLTIFFYTQVARSFKKGEVGHFEYVTGLLASHFFVIRIGGASCEWSARIFEQEKNAYRGLWIFLENEPYIKALNRWTQLKSLLSKEQFAQIARNSRNKSKTKNFQAIMLGSFIRPDSDIIRWSVISVRDIEKPIEPKTGKVHILEDEIKWLRSSDISYANFFGRGGLSPEITDRNILVLGLGAIGSKLTEHLTRGGARKLTLCDHDQIEPGNICRGQFHQTSVSIPKTLWMTSQVIAISPFTEVQNIPAFDPLPPDHESFRELRKLINQFDLIFDCSTDNSLALTLDRMKLSGKVVNLSISNEAKELFCFTGKNITQQKSHWVPKYQTQEVDETELFHETGCAYPTFRASNVDISSLLALAVKQINYCLGQNRHLSSFVISTKESDGTQQLELEVL